MLDAFLLAIILILAVMNVWLWHRVRRLPNRPSPEHKIKMGKRRFGLQLRMTFSYVWITIVSILVFALLLDFASIFFSQLEPGVDASAVVRETAQQYATWVADQAQGATLGNVFPYPLGASLSGVNPDDYIDSDARNMLETDHVVPYLSKLYPDSQPVTFALLVAPNMHILSSSYPMRYLPGASVRDLLRRQADWIQRALNGLEGRGTFTEPGGTQIYTVTPVWSRAGQPVGAIYVQVPLSTLHYSVEFSPDLLFRVFRGWLILLLVLVLVLSPLGGIFGFISTRGLIKRLKRLIIASTAVADGNYQYRLPVARRDEVGQLEQQFNRMAEQLGEGIARQKELAEENARLAERSRISRELHDAISQDLFSLSMLAGGLQSALPSDSPLQHQASILEQTTTNTIREMRALLLELRPTSLEQLGLVEALEELAMAYRTRLGITVRTDLKCTRLSARIEHTLLRIAQEALSNAARHANATEIEIALWQVSEMITLRIGDNGRGFRSDSEGLKHGLGLRLMRERIQEMCGLLKMESAPGEGTKLEICLPLKEDV
ncbi:MAG TPA: sensor histidine kinase [Ktedonobacteraceae bacterium]|jgi:signal transduction histidine kinase|nr:sensor histidine kinase [Ktedonobacteraceae bacterium]